MNSSHPSTSSSALISLILFNETKTIKRNLSKGEGLYFNRIEDVINIEAVLGISFTYFNMSRVGRYIYFSNWHSQFV
jgi:hypothetical protein